MVMLLAWNIVVAVQHNHQLLSKQPIEESNVIQSDKRARHFTG